MERIEDQQPLWPHHGGNRRQELSFVVIDHRPHPLVAKRRNDAAKRVRHLDLGDNRLPRAGHPDGECVRRLLAPREPEAAQEQRARLDVLRQRHALQVAPCDLQTTKRLPARHLEVLTRALVVVFLLDEAAGEILEHHDHAERRREKHDDGKCLSEKREHCDQSPFQND